MSIFTLAIFCLTRSNLPWFMDLTFQVPVQYCSLQHQTLLPSTVTFTTGCCFHYGCVFSFFLELFLHCSLVAYWVPTNLGSSSFSSYLFAFSWCSWSSFCSFCSFNDVQGKNTEVVPSPVDHVLSECSTMTHPSWVALHGMAASFIDCDKAVVHVISLISFLWLWFSFCLPSHW